MKHCLLAIVLATGVFSAAAQNAAVELITPNPNLKADGIAAIPKTIADKVALYTDFRGYSFVDWHPKENSMIVRHREAGANTPQLYLLSAPGAPLKKLTDFSDPVSAASFEPVNGKYIVYARDAGGNEATQVFRMDLDTLQSTLLSMPEERSTASWTRKGDRVLLSAVPLDKTAEAGKRENISVTLRYVNPLSPEEKHKLTELPGSGWFGFRFSHDDAQIAALRYRTSSDSEVYLINAKTGVQEKILPKEGAAKAGYFGFEWSKDNQSLFLTTNAGGEFSQLAVYDIKSKALKILSAHIPWDIENFRLSLDGKHLLAVVNNNGRDEVRLFDAQSGAELARPAIAAGALSGGDWHEVQTGVFAFSLNSPNSPGDVYSYDLAKSKLTRWTTAFAPPGLAPDTFIKPELVEIKSFDGLAISGWLYQPDAKKFPGKRPVFIDFHGGPEGQATVRFMGRLNYFLNEMGIAVLMPNVRGSSGYGKTFQNLDNGFKRKDSVKDGGAFIDWVATQPHLDANRIVVSGGSYGGYMSLAIAVDYSSKIRGAIDVVGISNFVTFLNNTESYRRDLRRVEYGDERDPAMREFQEKISPLNNAEKIKVPLFVIQGKNDPRVPYTEAEQIVAAVRKNGVPVWYLLADNEGHGFQRKANADFQFFATVKFLEETLLNPNK
ncbi:MAG: S9 family peptidase [Burkholderiaceae bacterium]|nr:S9 family peptidase [Burkholderiaceae bacterium]